MKTKILYGFAVLAGMTLASCNGDYDDWVDPISSTEGETAAKYGLEFKSADTDIIMPVDEVSLITLQASSENVTDYAIKEFTINDEAIDATVSDGNIIVSGADLQKLVTKQYNSRAAVKRDFTIKTNVSLILSTGDAVTTDVVDTRVASITPTPLPAEDPNGYYILADWQGWDTTAPQYMTNNGDGTYSVTVTTTNSGDNWFKFYEGSHFEAGNWDVINEGQMGCAVNGDGSSTGFIVYNGDPDYADGVQTPVISGEGTFEITIDVNNFVYTVKRAESKYFVVGAIQGWSDSDKSCMFYAEGGSVYSYTTQWAGEWDLKIWEEKDFGNWDVAWGTAVDGDGSVSGSLINASSQSFQAPTKGDYYTLTINMNSLTYEWTAVTPSANYSSVSLIGDFNGWGGDIDLVQLSGAPHNWYVRATIPSDGTLKFRADHDWTTSWGTTDSDTAVGEIYYLEPGEGNINVPAGTYDFYLNDITGRWNIVSVSE